MNGKLYGNFIIQKGEELTSLDSENLSKFYLPLIGAHAIVLYNFLAQKVQNNHTFYAPFEIPTLWKLLHMEYATFDKAKRELEALGLIKTYLNHQSATTQFWLKRPLNHQEVLENRVLSNELKHHLGKELFEDLVKEQVVHKVKTNQYIEDRSANFFDLFGHWEEEKPAKTHELLIEQGKINQFNLEKIAPKKVILNTSLSFSENQYINEYDALCSLNYTEFFKYLEGFSLNNEDLNVLEEYHNKFNDSKILNLVLLISRFSHKHISLKQVKSFLNELYKKGVHEFALVENYLDGKLLNTKKYNKALEKKNSAKMYYLKYQGLNQND